MTPPIPQPRIAPGLVAFGRAIAFLAFAFIAEFICFSLLYAMVGPVLAYGVTNILVALFATSLATGWFHALPWPVVGVHVGPKALRNLGVGIGVGLLAAGLSIAVPVAAGLARWEPDPKYPQSWEGLALVTFSMAGVAFGEELRFRGYPMQALARHFGPWIAVSLIAALFGFLHSRNPEATPMGVLNTTLWGLLLGLALFRSRDLMFPIGIHFAWNWALPLLGVPVSGFRLGTSGIKVVWTVDALWSGGSYGPEGGLINTMVLPLLALLVWKAPVTRERLPLVEEEKAS